MQFSQVSVIERVGVFVRLEAIRTEKHQTRFQPLQPYMDQEAIVKHSRPLRMNTRNHAPGGHGCANLIGCRSSAGA
jgi:hypothetical protein